MTARIYWTSRIKPWNMELYMHQYGISAAKIQTLHFKILFSTCISTVSAKDYHGTLGFKYLINDSVIPRRRNRRWPGPFIPYLPQNKPSHFHCLRWVSHASRHSKVLEKSSPSINGDSPEQKVKRIGETVSDLRWKKTTDGNGMYTYIIIYHIFIYRDVYTLNQICTYPVLKWDGKLETRCYFFSTRTI